MTTPDPLDGIMLPKALVFMPIVTQSQYLRVTAGGPDGATTIPVPVGTSQFVVDWNIPSGHMYIRTRLYLNQQLSFPMQYETISGTGTRFLRIINDDPDGWFALQGTATEEAVNTARMGVTIYPTPAT